MKRGLMLGGLAVCVFVVVAALMLKFMPAPLKVNPLTVTVAPALVATLTGSDSTG